MVASKESAKMAETKEESKVADSVKNKRSLPLLLGEAWSEDLGRESSEWIGLESTGENLQGGWVPDCGWKGPASSGFNIDEKTVTIVKETRVPVPVEKRIPYPVYKEVPYPVHVKVPQPYPVEKIVNVPVKVTEKVPEVIHKPVPVEKIVKVPVQVRKNNLCTF